MSLKYALAVAFAVMLGAAAAFSKAADAPQYHLLTEIPIGGGSGWDYLTADAATHRLYVTHRSKIVVIDTQTNKIVGEIADTPGVHGFVTASTLKRGFSSNGQENKVSIVDLESLKTLQKISTDTNPDAILFEPTSGEIWTFNGRGHSATVIDAATGKVLVPSIPLEGKPETGVADSDAGRVYVNIEDKNQIAVIDLHTHKVVDHWPITGGESPTGLVIDTTLHRLLIGCDNSKMIMMDSTNGKVLSTLDAGEGIDAAAFDPTTHLAFTSAGESGIVTIARVEADKLVPVQTLKTEPNARTMTVDTATHRIYLSTAKSRTDITGFKVLVYGIDESK